MAGCDPATIDQFWRLCDDAYAQWNVDGDTNVLGPLFVAVLRHVEQHPECRTQFEGSFTDGMTQRRRMLVDLMAFCMHTLRWPALRQVAEQLVSQNDDWRNQEAMRDVLDAFEDEWDDAILYDFYRQGRTL